MSLAVLDCEQVADRILYKRCQTAGSHILPIHANMLTGVLLCLLWQENLNANHKWQKRWELDFFNLYFFPFFIKKKKKKYFDNMFSCPLVLTFRAKCGKHVLRVFWWGHHSSSAQWMWNTETFEADREDCRYLCKCMWI